MLRNFIAKLPDGLQQELKRRRYSRQIKAGSFTTPEPEFARLNTWLGRGDWAIDVGANVGHYTLELARLVGPEGRVIAFEPIPATFALLAANVAAAGLGNVTLVNAAVSGTTMLARMTVPRYTDGIANYYEAKLGDTEGGGEATEVMCLPIDCLGLGGKVRLVKIDAEGHEPRVLQGTLRLLERDRPALIVEGEESHVSGILAPLGYTPQKLPGSPNVVFTANDKARG